MNAEMLDTDVLIIGGGAAGCSAAIKAHSLGSSVLMVVKGKMGRSGATPLASALVGPPPLKGPHFLIAPLKKLYAAAANVVSLPVPEPYKSVIRRMSNPHYGLVDQDYFLNFAIWALQKFFPALESTGIYIVRDESGRPVSPLGKNDYMLPYYIIHSHGMTGYQFGESKRKEVLTTDTVVLEEAMAFSLLQGGKGDVIGAMVFDYKHGRLYAVRAKATILATGHTNWLAKRSTGTREMAANGLAMAARVGAELQNLEIQWFHASDTVSPDSWMRLHHYPNPLTATEHRAVMRNRDGEMYMKIEEYDVNMPYT
ncbi:MAG: FAD-binding protein, partial [Alphaproteobacteria bacterium]